MKKRFLKRIENKYLHKRFPENLVPRKSGKQVRNTDQRNTLSGKLSPQLKRGARDIHQKKLTLNYSPLLQVDTLERGSLALSLPGNHSFKVWACLKNVIVNPDKRWQDVYNLRLQRKEGVSLYSSSQLEGTLSRQQEKRSSPLLLQLMEKKKLRILYGNLSNRETNSIIRKAAKGRGRFNDILFRLLESRLDVVLCKIGFFPTISFARQWVYHGKVLVNNKVTTLANYLLQPGDVISIAQSYCHHLKKHIHEKISKIGRDLESRSETGRGWAERPSCKHSWSKEHDTPVTLANQVAVLEPASAHPGWQLTAGHHLSLTKMVAHQRDNTWQFKEKLVKNKLRFFSLKLIHVEISFKLLTAIYLYPTQRVLLPAIIDVEKILNS